MRVWPAAGWHRALVAMVVVTVLAGACGGRDDDARATSTPAPRPKPTAPVIPSTSPEVSATILPAAFVASVAPVTGADLGPSWREGCPVGPDLLRRVTLAYWDFDGRVQTGALVVHVDVTDAVTTIFRRLFDARVPIRRMETIDRFGGSDDASMAADNTSAFNCRRAVSSGPAQWSAHAFGRAIDVNPVENPYVFGSTPLPPEGASFVNRAEVRRGMATPGGPLVEAFTAAGWQWGGRWAGSPDYQHFSADGS